MLKNVTESSNRLYVIQDQRKYAQKCNRVVQQTIRYTRIKESMLKNVTESPNRLYVTQDQRKYALNNVEQHNVCLDKQVWQYYRLHLMKNNTSLRTKS